MQLYHQIRRRYQSFYDPLHNEPFSCQGLLPEIAYGIHSIFPVQQESPFNEASKYPLHTLLRSPRLSFNSFGVRSMEDLAEAWERARRGAARGQRRPRDGLPPQPSGAASPCHCRAFWAATLRAPRWLHSNATAPTVTRRRPSLAGHGHPGKLTCRPCWSSAWTVSASIPGPGFLDLAWLTFWVGKFLNRWELTCLEVQLRPWPLPTLRHTPRPRCDPQRPPGGEGGPRPCMTTTIYILKKRKGKTTNTKAQTLKAHELRGIHLGRN